MKKLVVNFSGGRTSAYMAIRLWLDYRDQFELFFVFANTGKERPETLDFIQQVSIHYKMPIVWLEGVFDARKGSGVGFKVVNYQTADRTGRVFEACIAKYGLPNVSASHCSSKMKGAVVSAWKKANGLLKVDQALGIRIDEIDRARKSKLKFQFVYPLISMFPTRQEDVNKFWLFNSIDLQLKSYEGNCDLCFKKSLNKLKTIAIENPHLCKWWSEQEKKAGGKPFYRDYMTMLNIMQDSLKPFRHARDTSKGIVSLHQLEMDLQKDDQQSACAESCEAFTE